MTPDQILEKMKAAGISLSRPSLTRYESQGLIPEPKRGGGGRGVGMWTDYPEHTTIEAIAAWRMINGDWGNEEVRKMFDGKPPRIPPSFAAAARLMVLNAENDEIIERDPAAWTNDDDFKPTYQLLKKIRDMGIQTEEAKMLIWAFAASWRYERDQAAKICR